MRFNGPFQFREKTRELVDDLGRFANEVHTALKQLEDERAPRLTPVYVRGDYKAKLDELMIIDTSIAAVTITLPQLERKNSGRIVGYVRRDATNTLKFIAPGSTINGASSFTATASAGRKPDIAQGLTEWWA